MGLVCYVPLRNFADVESRDFNDQLIFELADQKLRVGEEVEISFKAKDFTEVMGYQYTIQFDENKLELLGIEGGGLPNMSMGNFGTRFMAEGLITTCWYNPSPLSLHDGTELFQIKFKVQRGGMLSDFIELSPKYTKAEGYGVQSDSKELGFLDIQLRFENAVDNPINTDEFVLYQNRPNPFMRETIISFQLPVGGEASLKVYDATRRLVLSMKEDFEKGYNEVVLDRGDFPGTGVFYYEVSCKGGYGAEAMILVE